MSALQLCSGWNVLAFSNKFGACVVNIDTASATGISMAQLEGLKTAKFLSTGQSIPFVSAPGVGYFIDNPSMTGYFADYVLEPTEDSITALSFGPASYKVSFLGY